MIEDKDYIYNQDPVFYCKDCGSLAIISVGYRGLSQCKKCGSTKLAVAKDIYWWENNIKNKKK